MQLTVILLLSALAAVPTTLGEAGGHTPSAPKANSPTYTMLSSFTGQLAIKMYTRQSPDEEWALHNCSAAAFGAACNQPILTGGSEQQVKITFSVKNTSVPFMTWKDGTPEQMIIRLDYAPIAQVDRGWRKKNQAYPGHGWHAKWNLATIAFNTSGEAVWELSSTDEVTDALLYPEVCTLCAFADGSRDYCHCDRRNTATNLNTIETAVANSVTPAMRAAAIALSVFSPLLLFVYALGDSLYYKRTGRSLQIVRT